MKLKRKIKLPPFPEGWYFLTDRKTVTAKKLIERTWMGEEIVIWCDADENICVADAFCPHLGSHLGPKAGGKVRDGCLVCPFHGFTFDSSGKCVSTPFAPPPPNARLKLYETREIAGMIFAWWGLEGRKPQWTLPDVPQDPEWCGIGYRRFRFPGHPQETAENSVDIAHLRYVHGYDNVYPNGEVEIDGAYLLSKFHFTRIRRIANIWKMMNDVDAVTHVHGIGYSFVEVRENTIEMDLRLWVLATPIDGREIHLTLASQVRELRKPKRFFMGLRFLPRRWRAPVITQFMLTNQKLDVAQDEKIWSRKRYRATPVLSRSDGEIGLYRRWCRQFYPENKVDDRSKSGLD